MSINSTDEQIKNIMMTFAETLIEKQREEIIKRLESILNENNASTQKIRLNSLLKELREREV